MQSDTNGGSAYGDNLSLLALTLSTLCDLKADANANGVFDCAHTDPASTTGSSMAGYQGGICHWNAAAPGATSSGWVCYLSRADGKVYLDKCVAGTWTNVLNAAVTYSAGATLQVIRVGASFSVYYNLAQVGSTSTVSDVELNSLTSYGAFRTDVSVTVEQVKHNSLAAQGRRIFLVGRLVTVSARQLKDSTTRISTGARWPEPSLAATYAPVGRVPSP